MPFVSEKQRKLCWYLYNKALREGKTPKWDCSEWERHTPKGKRLPSRKASKRLSKKRASKRKSSNK